MVSLWETGKTSSNSNINKSCSGEGSATGLTQAGHLMVLFPHPNDIQDITFFTFYLLLMSNQTISPSQNRGESTSSKYRNYTDSRAPNAISVFSLTAVRRLKNRGHISRFLSSLQAVSSWLRVWELHPWAVQPSAAVSTGASSFSIILAPTTSDWLSQDV